MALINCPECGREISNLATVCIGCGYPIKSEKGILRIKAQKYPEFWPASMATDREIGIYNSKGKEIASVVSGSAVTLEVNEEMEIFAKLKNMRLVKPSNKMRIIPNRTTRIMISYRLSTFSTTVLLSEVDVIDAE